MSLGIAFIHGAGLQTWIWDDLIDHLKTPSKAVQLPAEQEDLEDNSNLEFADYTRCIADQINEWNVEEYILVCHSIGGMLGLESIDKINKRLVGFLGVSAVIPQRGGSFVSSLPFPQKHVAGIAMKLAGTKPPRNSIVKNLCSGIGDEVSNKIADNWCAESLRLYTQKVGADIPGCAKAYVRTVMDRELSETLQKAAASELGSRKDLTLQTGHMPMLEAPEQLAVIVNSFAEDATN